jgi:hypothetical protein
VLFCLAVAAGTTAQETAPDIIGKVDLAQAVGNSRIETLMRIYPSDRNEKDFREFRMIGYSKGSDASYIEFVEPRSIKGLRILSLGDDTWLFFPSTGRVRKIAGTSKGDSVQGVGGDFSYEDISGSSLASRYDFTLLTQDARTWTLEGKSRAEKPVYGRIVMQIGKSSYLPVKIDYYLADDTHQKTLRFTDFKIMDGRETASSMTMVNHAKGSKTLVRTLSADYSAEVPERLLNPGQFHR